MATDTLGGRLQARRTAARLYAGIGAAFIVLVVALIGGVAWYNFQKTTD